MRSERKGEDSRARRRRSKERRKKRRELELSFFGCSSFAYFLFPLAARLKMSVPGILNIELASSKAGIAEAEAEAEEDATASSVVDVVVAKAIVIREDDDSASIVAASWIAFVLKILP